MNDGPTKNPTEFPEFSPFPKIARLSRDVVVSEKLDGTNAQVFIDFSGQIFAGSRNRWLTPEADNFGFARWVEGNKTELLKLGPGRHFGEWFGAGIQRTYGLKEKRFALFNVARWYDILNPTVDGIRPGQELVPGCCHVVPTLYRGEFSTGNIEEVLKGLAYGGSIAVPGFMQPEGIVIYHTASGQLFKKTVLHDESPKGQVA